MGDELAWAFADAGHQVQVVALPWNSPTDGAINQQMDHPGVNVIRVHPIEFPVGGKIAARLSKWGLSSFWARKKVEKMLNKQSFDLLISASPAVTTAGLITWALKRFNPKSFIHVVDFFPFHQRALGLIPGRIIMNLAKRAENALLQKFDVIGCMSPANIAYLESHYNLPSKQRHCLLPIFSQIETVPWDQRNEVRNQYGLPRDRAIAVFGGQLTEGRGIPEILETARLSHEAGDNLDFLIIGRGRLGHLVEAYRASGRGNLSWIEELPRVDYLSVAAACDVGMVITVGGVDVPTFPSKTIDYLRAGLPIAAAVEDSTDYGDFIIDNGLGHAVQAGNPERFLDALHRALGGIDRTIFEKNAHRVLREQFDVKAAAITILKETCSQ